MDFKKTVEYYNKVAKTYDMIYGDKSKPGPNKYRLEIVKKMVSEKISKNSKILDAGCGTGRFLLYLVENDYDCYGCDFSSGMLLKAKQNIGHVSSREVPLIKTSIDNLSMFEDNFFDHVFCLGVFPYILEEYEEKCYKEIYRVIKPGGFFITAHENEIFDTFSFNKYTIRFFERNIYTILERISNDINKEDMKNKLESLIVNPKSPINTNPNKSARDIIFVKPENPITYSDKILKFGFANKEILYYNFHALPPLIRNNDKELLELSNQMEFIFSDKWQGMFLASTFISVSCAI